MQFKKFLYNGYVSLVLQVEETNIDKLNNKSTIEWILWIQRESAYTYDLNNGSKASVQIGDDVVFNQYVSHDLRNKDKEELGRGTKEIVHDENGEKSITVWARMLEVAGLADIDWFSGTFTLTKIERESQIKNVIATELGQPVEIQIDRKVPDFRHQAWYRINGSSWFDLGDKIAYAKMFVPSVDLATHIPNSDTGVIDVCVRTYLGDKQIGNDVYVRDTKIKVPESVVPTMENMTVSEFNNKVARLMPQNEYLTTVSHIKAEIIGAKAVLGATISTFKIKMGSTVSYYKEGYFRPDKAGMFDIIGEITDSRGRIARVTKSVKIHDYKTPKINVFLPLRSGNGTNKNVKAQTSITVSDVRINGRSINEYRVQVEYLSNGSPQWTTALNETSTQPNYVKTIDLGSVYELSQSYDFTLTVNDKFGYPVSATWHVRPSKVLAVFSRNGFHLGEMPEENEKDMFTSALPAKFKNTVSFDNDVFYKTNRIQLYGFTSNNGSALALPNSDLNMVTKTGLYSLVQASKNTPPDYRNFNGSVLRVTHNNTGLGVTFIIQEYLAHNCYMYRTFTSNNWSDWKYIIDPDTDWKRPVLESGWKHDADYGEIYFSKVGDVVYLRGNMKDGATAYDSKIFTLPPKYRPKVNQYLIAINGSYDNASFIVQKNGDIRVRYVKGNWVGFDGVSFKI